MIPAYLACPVVMPAWDSLPEPSPYALVRGSAASLIPRLAPGSVNCVVTSPPYWGTRLYADAVLVAWADGEVSVYGHEQTPEGFIRHTVQLLCQIRPALAPGASVWLNIADTYNTRTQIRGSAAETLRAMQGRDACGWHDYDARRYSAGHSWLKDGEQCLIPHRIAERAARAGYHVKSVITWAKTGNLPEPQDSRVSRAVEYVLHLAVTRTPVFAKAAYHATPPELGGRNPAEPGKLTDTWLLPTSAGRNGHGAQFPVALPGRCIALSTCPGDLTLDPFAGGCNTGLAALALGRRFLGIDTCGAYLAVAEGRLAAASGLSSAVSRPPCPGPGALARQVNTR
jgi:DNA modification methylase